MNKQSFDLMDGLSAYLQKRGGLGQLSIGWHCHITSLTVAAATVATECGARLFISEASPTTTMTSALQGLQNLGVKVYTGANNTAKVLAHKPVLLSDTGLVLIEDYLRAGAIGDFVRGACEVTATGINRLHQIESRQTISLPIINVNKGELKTAIDNFHGVGDGLIEALQLATGKKHLPGNVVVVIGYGRVGSGCAQYLKSIGTVVKIIERDPIRALKAHYDGFALTDRQTALAQAEIIVTATGQANLWQGQFFGQAKEGMVVINVGHDRQEVSPDLWQKKASKIEVVNEVLSRYTFNSLSDKCLYLATEGNPANIALLTGSFEPSLIHLATELLTWNYLGEKAETLPYGESSLPRAIEEEVGKLALTALGYATENGF